MLVTESLCWWLFSLCWWFFQCTNILNRSPTSQTCHQHIWSVTTRHQHPMLNIDVTLFACLVLSFRKTCFLEIKTRKLPTLSVFINFLICKIKFSIHLKTTGFGRIFSSKSLTRHKHIINCENETISLKIIVDNFVLSKINASKTKLINSR